MKLASPFAVLLLILCTTPTLHAKDAAMHPITLPALRTELDAMATTDQAARTAWVNDGLKHGSPAEKRMQQLDAQHLLRLRVIMQRYGFPDTAQVGHDGVEDFWLLSQHAVSDKPFMDQVLRLARPLMLKGELPRRDYALMVDRVRIQQGRKQLYGSQFHVVAGHLVMLPLEDPAHVDQRRAAMDMMPEAEYEKMGEQHLHPAPTAATSRKS